MTTERVPASTDRFTHVREASQKVDPVYPESGGTVSEINSTNMETGQLYFTELSKLVLIGQQMMSRYYSTIKVQQASSTKALWIIRELLNEVDKWSTTLPYGLNIRVTGTPSKSKITSQRLSLELQFHSIRITISRPTLDVQVSEATDQNDRREPCPQEYLAAECVNSACHIIRVLAQASKKIALHDIPSWWFVLHFLMQATTVLCREIRDGCRHVPERASVYKRAARTPVSLLSNLSKNCESWRRALKFVKPLVERLLSNDGKVENKRRKMKRPTKRQTEG
jgi:hypothetical protein